ncbi:MAG: VWA domain-containing protein [Planctomycetota bacterium]|nr:MAG: VWA domain-containing protein [Planctomycetota bacterium]REK20035.1 MAG: VWA domain-containing protein [Planctomycetota bacterium]REK33455.1 MAG: VWA domain-containing protein [Planctomycetota bacterium]
MSLLNPAILFGMAFVAVPVILHLLLRQKPKKLIFPALRLIQQRRKQNVRRLRLRHIWLLLLRMLAIALIVIAIARPSLPAADYSLSGSETITLLVVIAAAVGVYFFILRRWRRELPKFEYVARRSALRGWTTGLTLLLLLLAVGWPYQRRVAAEITAPPPDARIDVPVTAVLLFDTSQSMEYQQQGMTRLDVARQIALEHISTLPAGSRLAVADTASDNPIVFQSTVGLAQARIEALEIEPVSLSINDRLRAALQEQERDLEEQLNGRSGASDGVLRDNYLRRVYVFTDLAATAWRLGGSELLAREMERLEQINVYLVDVGELQPKNVGVSGITLSRHRIPRGGDLVVGATVSSIGLPPSEKDVELMLTDAGGQPVFHGRRTVNLQSGEPQRIEFDLISRLVGPVVHGDVRLVSSDPLEMDDVRRFTVEVGPPPRVLVLAMDGESTKEWLYALNPGDPPKFEAVYAPVQNLFDIELSEYDVVCMINIQRLTDESWLRLGQYVDQGGGLAIFLGDEDINPVNYQRGQAQAFLPASLDAWVPSGDWRLSLDNINHPIFRKIRQYADSDAAAILENEAEIYKFWKVEPAQGAAVLATYTDEERSPALIERLYGKGRVVMLTTAVDQKPRRRRWNTLTNLVNAWAYLALVQPLTEHLARISDENYTIEAGDSVTLTVSPEEEDRQLLLRRPDLTQTRRDVPAGRTRITISDETRIGHYDLAASGNAPPIAGFTVNPPAAESDFTRLTQEQLDELLGPDRYGVARDIDELKADINIADLGKEVFPILMLLVIVAFCGEHLVANRFYETDNDLAAAGEPATSAPESRRSEELAGV